MKPSLYRRIRHRKAPSRSEGAFFKKESQETFFGGSEHESFFKSAVTPGAGESVQRKCEKCEEEEKQVQRAPEKKEEEKVMRVEGKKEEDKVMKKDDKKEEEKIQREPEKKEEEKKVMRVEEKKEEEKVMKKEDKKEEEKIQREPEKKEEEKLRKKEATSSNGGGSKVSNYIGSLNGKGESLPSQANHFFSARMGYDFSQVRVHKDKEAAESAKAVNAKAYAVGNNIVFNEGQFNTGSTDGKKLMAHELTHVIQQDDHAVNRRIQRQVAPPVPVPAPAAPAPHFRDCVESVTGRTDADAILSAAMDGARQYVTNSIALLANAPVPGTVYEMALATHFGSPIGEVRRLNLQTVFRRILQNLVVGNFICNRTACPNRAQALFRTSDNLLHICPPFWLLQDVNCRSIVMIHEAAHESDIGVDITQPHPPDRGRRSYPVVGAPAVTPRRSVRADSPDAYGFFAAHVYNGADTAGRCASRP